MTSASSRFQESPLTQQDSAISPSRQPPDASTPPAAEARHLRRVAPLTELLANRLLVASAYAWHPASARVMHVYVCEEKVRGERRNAR